jgi:hypothetical protein
MASSAYRAPVRVRPGPSVACRSSGAQPTKAKPLAVSSVYGSGLLLAVALVDVLVLVPVDVDEETVGDVVGGADESLVLVDGEDVVDVVKVVELLLGAAGLLLEGIVTDEDDCINVPFLKIDKRNPAPQVSNILPAQGKLQSVAGARTEPALKEFPQ